MWASFQIRVAYCPVTRRVALATEDLYQFSYWDGAETHNDDHQTMGIDSEVEQKWVSERALNINQYGQPFIVWFGVGDITMKLYLSLTEWFS